MLQLTYFELDKRDLSTRLELVRLVGEQAPDLYRSCWEYGYQIRYPVRERLNSHFLEEWLQGGNYAYAAVQSSTLVAIALLAIEQDARSTIIEGCGAAVDPRWQKSGVGKELSQMRVCRRDQFAGEIIHTIGANYVSSGSQATSVRQELDVTSLQFALYNNAILCDIWDDPERNSYASNGEVIFEACFSDGKKRGTYSRELSVADPRMLLLLRKIGFASVSLLSASPSQIFHCSSHEDERQGRVDYYGNGEDELNLDKLSLEQILRPDERCKRLFVPLSAYPVQAALAESLALPVGISLAHGSSLIYQVLPKDLAFPQICLEERHHAGGCRDGRVARVHSPLPSVVNAYRYLHSLHERG